MGEIDENAERLAALDPLQPPRHALDRLQAANHRGQVDAVSQSDGRRRQTVVDVMAADHLRADGNRLLPAVSRNVCSLAELLDGAAVISAAARMPTVNAGPSAGRR